MAAAGILSSVMNMFSPNGGATISPAPNTPQVTVQMAPPTTNNSPNTSLPGVDPANPTAPANADLDARKAAEAAANPLDSLKDIWTLPTPDANAPKKETIDTIFSSLDPAKIQEQVGKLDFSKGLDPELMNKITKGGPEAQVALLGALNAVAQTTLSQSILATSNITKNALTRASAIQKDDLSAQIRSSSAREEIAAVNAMYNHPASKPMVDALTHQFLLKNPNATTEEIKTQVVDALGAFGSAFNPVKKDESKNSNQSKDTDWSLFG